MTDGLSKQLEALAAKLNVSVDILWAALIKQAPVSGMADLLMYAGYLGGVYVLYKWGRAIIKHTAHDAEDRWDDICWLPFIIAAALIFIMMFSIFSHVPMTFAAFFNSEYWALKQLF